MKKRLIIMLLLLSSLGFSQNWKTNFDEAKTQAINESKYIILVFTGSDWCSPCIKLDRTIFESEAFKTESDKKWILVKADFPKKKNNQLATELGESNKKLAEKYNKSGNFPFVVLLDNTGKVLGMTGYKNVTPQEYIDMLHKMETK
jgi:thioredoxin-related protein